MCIFFAETDYFLFNLLAFNVLAVVFPLTITHYQKHKNIEHQNFNAPQADYLPKLPAASRARGG